MQGPRSSLSSPQVGVLINFLGILVDTDAGQFVAVDGKATPHTRYLADMGRSQIIHNERAGINGRPTQQGCAIRHVVSMVHA